MTLTFPPGSADAAAAQPLARRLDRLAGMTLDAAHSPSAGLLLERALMLVAEAEQMLADQRARIAQLERLSMTDELTGLFNRRGFLSHLRRELSNARRHGRSGVLVLLDLDGLKAINDTHGHAAGDAAIRLFSVTMTAAVRGGDIVGRLGGDEFALLLHRATKAGASRRIATLRRTLAEATIPWHGAEIPLQACFGVAGFAEGDDEDTLIARADDALYADKRKRKATAGILARGGSMRPLPGRPKADPGPDVSRSRPA